MIFGILETKTDKELVQLKTEITNLKESYEGELRRRDVGWTTLQDIQKSNTDFSFANREAMTNESRKAFIYSPGGKRMVRYVTSYVMGNSFKISSSNEAVQFIIEIITKNPLNFWKRQLKNYSNRIQVDGEVFITVHLQETGESILRETNSNEITEILTDPDDIMIPILFKREYEPVEYEAGEKTAPTEKTEYIPSLYATDELINKLNMPADANIITNRIIHQVKTISFNDRIRGLSDFSTILYYLSRLRNEIDRRMSANKLKEAFYLDVAIDGSPAEVQAEAGKSQYKRPPKAGSTLFHNKAIDVNIKQPTINHEDQNKSLDPILQQITMGSGMPEWMLLGNANMYKAGAEAQSAPFTKVIEDYQELWNDEIMTLFIFLIKVFLDRNKDRVFLDGTKGAKGLLSQIDSDHMVDKVEIDSEGNETVTGRIHFWETMQIQFPTIIVKSDKEETDAITSDIGNKLVSRKTASTIRGYNYEEEKIIMGVEQKEDLKNDPLAQTLLQDEHDQEEQDEDEDEGE